MRKLLSILIVFSLLLSACVPATATPPTTASEKISETALSGNPSGEAASAGEKPDGTPPEKPDGAGKGGTPPDGTPPDGQTPDGKPSDKPSGGKGGPGKTQAVTDYSAALEITEDTTLDGGAYTSTGTDENAIHVSAGTLTLNDATVTRDSADSTGGDNASFYGVGAAVLATGGSAVITGGSIATTANGAAGVFAYGDGTVQVKDTKISTTGNTAGGIHVAGGGTLKAENLTVVTQGDSSAAIRSDRGGGTMTVSGGSYTSNGVGSPAVYVTADITVENAELTATGSEALCLEGLNSVQLTNCTLTGSMQDLTQNDNTWTVILYQSMSGDAQVGKGTFAMTDGALISKNGGLFYTTNTESEFTLENVSITAASDSEYFLRVTGNQNERGWGTSGKNGAQCVFTAKNQQMPGDVIWDSISTLTLNVTEGSTLQGAVKNDETCAGDGGDGSCTLTVDAASQWIVTADSRLTTLHCAGTLTGADGKSVTVQGTDGTIYVQGAGAYTVTVDEYKAS